VTRVNFECIAGQRTFTLTGIDVKNNGTTAIFYEWRKIHHVASFEALKPDQVQRFYFNANEGTMATFVRAKQILTLFVTYSCFLEKLFVCLGIAYLYSICE